MVEIFLSAYTTLPGFVKEKITMPKLQIDHTEECILLAMLEQYPLPMPEDRLISRSQELSGLSADEYASNKNRIIAAKAMLLSAN